MSGRNKWRDLARPIHEDPARRARLEERKRAYDALLDAAEEGRSDEELEAIARGLGLPLSGDFRERR